MVIKKDGSVWATCYSAYGQLGDKSASNSQTFVQVMFGGAKAIAATTFALSKMSRSLA